MFQTLFWTVTIELSHLKGIYFLFVKSWLSDIQIAFFLIHLLRQLLHTFSPLCYVHKIVDLARGLY